MRLLKELLAVPLVSILSRQKGVSDAAPIVNLGGFELAAETETNQIFPILPNALIESLKQMFEFYVWEKVDDHRSVVRLVTSWATDEAQVDSFIRHIEDSDS